MVTDVNDPELFSISQQHLNGHCLFVYLFICTRLPLPYDWQTKHALGSDSLPNVCSVTVLMVSSAVFI